MCRRNEDDEGGRGRDEDRPLPVDCALCRRNDDGTDDSPSNGGDPKLVASGEDLAFDAPPLSGVLKEATGP